MSSDRSIRCGLALIVGTTFASQAAAAPQQSVSVEAAAIHERLITLDSHLDTPASLDIPGWSIADEHREDYSQVDLPRMKEGGLDGGFWAIYTPQGPLDASGYAKARDFAVMRGVSIRTMLAADPENFALATLAEEAATIAADRKRIVYMSIENAYPLGEDLTLVKLFYDMGVRIIGLTHFAHNQFADSATDPSKTARWDGLSPLGKELIREMNRQGIVADASHSSDAALDDMLALSTTPLILTHSGCKAIYDHPRNIDDARLQALAAKGGVIQMNAYGAYLRAVKPSPARDQALAALFASRGRGPETAQAREAFLAKRREIDILFPANDKATFDDFMAHLLHALKVVGPDHVGIGLDWDGGGGVTGMEDVSAIPRITAALLAAGYGEADLKKIWSGNALRVLAASEVARTANPTPTRAEADSRQGFPNLGSLHQSRPAFGRRDNGIGRVP